jgi:glycosyltransferase involved in cell wall biosynthesis
MPRKRQRDADLIFGALRNRGTVSEWRLRPIDGMSEEQAAAVMRQSPLFLSFSHEEGFGLPPLEALACGCKVIGYHGIGGREFFREPFATTIEDGDVVSFAEAIEQYARSFSPVDAAVRAREAAAYVASRYTSDQENADVVAAFRSVLDEAAKRPPAHGMLDASQTWVTAPWSWREQQYWRFAESVGMRVFGRTRARSR